MDLAALYDKYGKEKVDDAVKYLTYKNPEATKELPKTELPNIPTLYVFRHGQSEDNLDMIFSGWRDVDLTEEGIHQAEILADKLKDKKIQMLVSSDQKRTLDTMKIAISKNEYAKGSEIIQDKRLRERNYGDWQGTSKLDMQLKDPEGLARVRRGWNDAPPNGESIANVDDRVGELLREIIPQMKSNGINVAIACSGNSIRPIRKMFEELTEDEAAKIETPTGKDYAAYPIK